MQRAESRGCPCSGPAHRAKLPKGVCHACLHKKQATHWCIPKQSRRAVVEAPCRSRAHGWYRMLRLRQPPRFPERSGAGVYGTPQAPPEGATEPRAFCSARKAVDAHAPARRAGRLLLRPHTCPHKAGKNFFACPLDNVYIWGYIVYIVYIRF